MTEKSVQTHFEIEELAFQHRRWGIALVLVLAAFMVWQAVNGLNTQPAVKNAAASQPGIIPTQLHIPGLGINVVVQEIGAVEAGELADNQLGWLKTGVKPGESGTAVLVYRQADLKLSTLKPGDKVYIADSSGRRLTFEVKSLTSGSGNLEQLSNSPEGAGEKELRLVDFWPEASNSAATWLMVSTRLVTDQG